MLNTQSLEKEVKNKVNRVFPEMDFSQIKFCQGTDNSLEGTYIFTENDKYQIVFAEKGKIRTHEEFETVEDILWKVLDIILFEIAMDYAIKNRVKGKDFRRLFFAKEIELYKKFGKYFKNKKIIEINEILKENPFNDN